MIILAKTYLKFQEEMSKDENKDKQVQLILKHFYNIDDYTKLKYDDVEQKVTYISNILNDNHKLQPIIKINNINYGIVPDFQDVTLGELYDLEQNITILEQMSILYRPTKKQKGDKYKIEKYSGKLEKELFENNITVQQMISFTSFFLTLSEEFLRYMKKYMEEEATRLNLKKASVKNGGGMASFIDYVKEKFGN